MVEQFKSITFTKYTKYNIFRTHTEHLENKLLYASLLTGKGLLKNNLNIRTLSIFEFDGLSIGCKGNILVIYYSSLKLQACINSEFLLVRNLGVA